MFEVRTKVCSKCGKKKPITTEYFSKRKIAKDGFRNQCNNCLAELKKKRYWSSTDKLEAHRTKMRELYYENIDKYKQYYQDNRDERIQYRKDYYKNNTEDCIKRTAKWKKLAYETNELYRIQEDIRRRISNSLRIGRWTKKSLSFDILGCDVETFRNHIESQFKNGMNWNNRGKNGWHYDHIIPISSATTEEESIELNHYTNFQPLWAKDNLRKSNKISKEFGNIFVS